MGRVIATALGGVTAIAVVMLAAWFGVVQFMDWQDDQAESVDLEADSPLNPWIDPWAVHNSVSSPLLDLETVTISVASPSFLATDLPWHRPAPTSAGWIEAQFDEPLLAHEVAGSLRSELGEDAVTGPSTDLDARIPDDRTIWLTTRAHHDLGLEDLVDRVGTVLLGAEALGGTTITVQTAPGDHKTVVWSPR